MDKQAYKQQRREEKAHIKMLRNDLRLAEVRLGAYRCVNCERNAELCSRICLPLFIQLKQKEFNYDVARGAFVPCQDIDINTEVISNISYLQEKVLADRVDALERKLTQSGELADRKREMLLNIHTLLSELEQLDGTLEDVSDTSEPLEQIAPSEPPEPASTAPSAPSASTPAAPSSGVTTAPSAPASTPPTVVSTVLREISTSEIEPQNPKTHPKQATSIPKTSDNPLSAPQKNTPQNHNN